LTKFAFCYDNKTIGKPINGLYEKKMRTAPFRQEVRRSPNTTIKEAILSIAPITASGKPNMPIRYKPSLSEGHYIRYKTNLAGTKLAAIARNLNTDGSTVSKVIHGRRRSTRIEAEIARILGKASWNEVVLEARSEIQKKPVAVIVREMEQKLQAAQNLKPELTTDEIIAARDWGPYLKAMKEQMPEIERREREEKRRRA
jgi:hypothetical protein